MFAASGAVAFLAGALTTLSPCVLPILPLVLGAAGRKDRWAPAFICMGLAFSFALVGWTIAAFGSLAGLEGDQLRWISASLLGIFGLVFLSTRLSEAFSRLLQPLASGASDRLNRIEGSSRAQNFMIGALLGALWSPCSGPTLGAAVGLASRSGSGWASFFTMLAFGLGAAMPLGLFAGGLNTFLRKYQQRILSGSARGKRVLGALMVIISLLVLTGMDKKMETKLNQFIPERWSDLITRF